MANTGLKGRTALVTGAASGIGAAVAIGFAAHGASVVLADRDEARARAVAATIDKDGRSVLPVMLDVSDESSVARAVSAGEAQFGGIDILFTSAGIGLRRPMIETTLDDWTRVLTTNLTGTFLCCRAVAPGMTERGWGRIITVSSGAGLRPTPGRAAYAASKGGVNQFTVVLAAELGRHGITANAIAPGPIETPLVAAQHSEATRQRFTAATPVPRYGRPEEIAAAALFLSSEDAAFINGQVLAVDGGKSAAGTMLDIAAM